MINKRNIKDMKNVNNTNNIKNKTSKNDLNNILNVIKNIFNQIELKKVIIVIFWCLMSVLIINCVALTGGYDKEKILTSYLKAESNFKRKDSYSIKEGNLFFNKVSKEILKDEESFFQIKDNIEDTLIWGELKTATAFKLYNKSKEIENKSGKLRFLDEFNYAKKVNTDILEDKSELFKLFEVKKVLLDHTRICFEIEEKNTNTKIYIDINTFLPIAKIDKNGKIDIQYIDQKVNTGIIKKPDITGYTYKE